MTDGSKLSSYYLNKFTSMIIPVIMMNKEIIKLFYTMANKKKTMTNRNQKTVNIKHVAAPENKQNPKRNAPLNENNDSNNSKKMFS